MDPTLSYWIEKGGAFAVIALLVYFYRRDWTTLTQYWQQQNTLLMEIVRTNTSELGKVQASITLMHSENQTHMEALRTRLHELSDAIHVIAGAVAVQVHQKTDQGSHQDRERHLRPDRGAG